MGASQFDTKEANKNGQISPIWILLDSNWVTILNSYLDMLKILWKFIKFAVLEWLTTA